MPVCRNFKRELCFICPMVWNTWTLFSECPVNWNWTEEAKTQVQYMSIKGHHHTVTVITLAGADFGFEIVGGGWYDFNGWCKGVCGIDFRPPKIGNMVQSGNYYCYTSSLTIYYAFKILSINEYFLAKVSLGLMLIHQTVITMWVCAI